jgi:hypothetical protein
MKYGMSYKSLEKNMVTNLVLYSMNKSRKHTPKEKKQPHTHYKRENHIRKEDNHQRIYTEKE